MDNRSVSYTHLDVYKRQGLVLDNSESGDPYKLVVYNISGKHIFDTTFGVQYTDIQLDVYKRQMQHCALMRYYQPFPAAIPQYKAGYPRVTHPSATQS